jgi:hypothetical protein
MHQSSRSFWLFAAIGFITAWLAVGLQYYLLLVNKDGSVVPKTIEFISYFTILTNSLAGIYFTAVLFSKPAKTNWLTTPQTATAIAVYITIVGLVYNIVLRALWTPTGLQKWVDETLHTFNPLLFVLFWLLFVPKQTLKWKHAFPWLLYPFLYLLYILSRGALSGEYPYPFINVGEIGYAEVLLNSGVLLLVFVFFSLLFIGIGKLISKNKSLR